LGPSRGERPCKHALIFLRAPSACGARRTRPGSPASTRARTRARRPRSRRPLRMRPARRPASGNCRSAPCRTPTPGRLPPARPHAACQRGAASSLRLLHRSCLAPAAVPCLGPACSAGGSVGRSRPGARLSGCSKCAPTRYRPLQPSTSSRHERPMSRGRRPRGARLNDVDLARGRPGAVRKPAGHFRGGAGPRSGGLLPRRRGQHPQRRPDAVAP